MKINNKTKSEITLHDVEPGNIVYIPTSYEYYLVVEEYGGDNKLANIHNGTIYVFGDPKEEEVDIDIETEVVIYDNRDCSLIIE